MPDAVVVGAGPNGLAAAVVLARAGLRVEVYERNDSVGGAARTLELTEPGFRHDLGATVHAMGLGSPFFKAFELEKRIQFATPDVSFAHPINLTAAGIVYRDLDRTAEGLGPDGSRWKCIFGALAEGVDQIMESASKGVMGALGAPTGSVLLATRIPWFLTAAVPKLFHNGVAPALLAGLFAHAIAPITSFPAVSAGLVLGTQAHAAGWPFAIGGSQAIADALAADIIAHGGVIHTNVEIARLEDLPNSSAILMDVSARDAARVGASRFPAQYISRLQRFRYGPAAFKVDFALSGPIPWANSELAGAGTVHLGGSYAAIRKIERDVSQKRDPRHAFVIVAQPSSFDSSRAPKGKQTAWAYMHVPNASVRDWAPVVIDAIEAHAPGFRDLVLASRATSPAELEALDPNLVGGDISSGAMSTRQFIARPVMSAVPWRTPAQGVYLASSSTPPGSGVHGLAGANAAVTALRDIFGVHEMPDLSIEAGSPDTASGAER